MAIRLILGAWMMLWPAAVGADEAVPAAGTTVILDEGSYWRARLVWRPPMLRTAAGLEEFLQVRSAVASFIARSDPPPAEWTRPGFPDHGWMRWRLQRRRVPETEYGFLQFGGGSPALAAQCLRGKFDVVNPAPMTLRLAYRGGVAVYINGAEIARAGFPKDAGVDMLALAEDYPEECFVKPDGQCIRAEFSDPRTFKDRVEKRIRRLEAVTVPAERLRKGANLLAVEIHRAPYRGGGLGREGLNHRSVWSTCGLVSLELRAPAGSAEPNTGRPKGLQVWNSGITERLTPADYGDPCERLEPMVIPAARNGSFTGKVAVSSDGPIRGLGAEAGELVARDGNSRILAANVRVLYTVRDDRTLSRYVQGAPLGFYDTLVESPPAEVPPGASDRVSGLGAILPVWVKVRVPADAAPGEYRGKLRIRTAGGSPVEVPLCLSVADWKLPDPMDWTAGHLAFIQSPDTLAIQYQKNLWSEDHWRLMEKSFQLMGEMGNKYVWIPMIARTNFGNEQSMIRWVKDGDPSAGSGPGGGYKHDFAVFDRYLELAQKYMKPDVVCLYVWERYTGEYHWAGVGERQGKPPLVTSFDPASQKAEDMETPRLGTPEAKAFWEPVFREVRARLERRGLLPFTMMGMNGDAYRPTDAMGKMFAELMPGTKWINNSHGDTRGSQTAGIPIGYNTAVYIGMFPPPAALPWDATRKVGWRLPCRTDVFPRSMGPATGQMWAHTAPLGIHRQTVEAALLANCTGVGRVGFDFWPVLGAGSVRHGVKNSASVGGRWPPCWDQLNLDRATENLVSPGPDGALPTERFENVREGMMECEARVFIERALIDPATRGRLGRELAAKCQNLLDERAWLLRGACISGQGFEISDGEAQRTALYAAAAEVAARLR